MQHFAAMGGNKKVVKLKKPHSRHQRDLKKYLKKKQRQPERPSRRCPFNPSSALPDVLKRVFLGKIYLDWWWIVTNLDGPNKYL